jgi:DNA polymerase I
MQTLLFEQDKSQYWFIKDQCEYHLVTTEEQARDLSDILNNADLICFDVETTGLQIDSGRLVGFSVCVEEGVAYYLPIHHTYGENLPMEYYNIYIKPHLINKPILGHNLKFDYKFAKAYLDTRINVKEDTFVISKLLECFDFNGLKPLSELLFNLNVLDLVEILGQYSITPESLDLLSPEEIYEYCCQDTDLTLRLFKHFVNKFDWKRTYIYDEEIRLVESLARIEMRGVLVDKDFLVSHRQENEEAIKEISDKIIETLEAKNTINLDSNIQVSGAILTKYPKFKKNFLFTKKTGRVKMDEDSVNGYVSKFDVFKLKNGLEDENVFSLLLDRKKLFSIVTKYLSPWINMVEERKTDIIYTNFNSLGTDTGRMSSNDPNLQNVTLKIRRAIVPRKGYYFISMDYSQIEFRIFLAMAGLDHLTEKINQGDVDVHRMAASMVYHTPEDQVTTEQRRAAKTLNFGILYRMGAHSLARNLDISLDEAEELLRLYNEVFLRSTDWFDRVIKFSKRHGFVLTAYGRKRRIDNINIYIPKFATYQERKELMYLYSSATRKAINTPIQGTAADIMKIGINKVFDMIDSETLDIYPIITVHDDLVFEISSKYEPEFIVPKLKSCLETKFKDKINLVVDCKISEESWAGLKD